MHKSAIMYNMMTSEKNIMFLDNLKNLNGYLKYVKISWILILLNNLKLFEFRITLSPLHLEKIGKILVKCSLQNDKILSNDIKWQR